MARPGGWGSALPHRQARVGTATSTNHLLGPLAALARPWQGKAGPAAARPKPGPPRRAAVTPSRGSVRPAAGSPRQCPPRTAPQARSAILVSIAYIAGSRGQGGPAEADSAAPRLCGPKPSARPGQALSPMLASIMPRQAKPVRAGSPRGGGCMDPFNIRCLESRAESACRGSAWARPGLRQPFEV